MEEFEISVDDFEALKKLIEIGQPAVAIAKFKQITGVSNEDATYYIEQLAAETPGAEAEAEPPQAPAPPPPPTVAPPPAITESPTEPRPPAPAPMPSRITRQSESRGDRLDPSEYDPPLRWYHILIGALSFPLILGGGLGGLCFGAAFAASYKIFKSGPISPPLRYVLSLVCTLTAFTVWAVVAGFFVSGPDQSGKNSRATASTAKTAIESAKSAKREIESAKPDTAGAAGEKPSEFVGSDPSDWFSSPSESRSAVDPVHAEFQLKSVLIAPSFGPVSVSETADSLTLESKPTGPSEPSGITPVNPQGGLSARFKTGEELHLIAVAVRMPSISKDRTFTYHDPVSLEPIEPEWEGQPLDPGLIPPSRYQIHPIVRFIFAREKGRLFTSSRVHLFDARTEKDIGSGSRNTEIRKPAEDQPMSRKRVTFPPYEMLDVDWPIWHDTPLEIYATRVKFLDSEKATLDAKPGAQVRVGPGRVQLAYLGMGKLEGVEDNGRIEPGNSYRRYREAGESHGGLLIARFSPPALARYCSMRITDAGGDGYGTYGPRFGNKSGFQAGAFYHNVRGGGSHSTWLIDNEIVNRTTGVKERALDFNSVKIEVSWSEAERAKFTVPGLPGLQTAQNLENLFDLEIPYLYFRTREGSMPILQTAANAVEFKLSESALERGYPASRSTREYNDVTPKKLLQEFEKITGTRVIVDNEAMTIDVR